jgi:hypothetical protein
MSPFFFFCTTRTSVPRTEQTNYVEYGRLADEERVLRESRPPVVVVVQHETRSNVVVRVKVLL